RILQQEHRGCAGKEAGLVEKLTMVEKEKYDLLSKSREQEERIKKLEEDLASKTSSLAEAEGHVVSSSSGGSGHQVVDLSFSSVAAKRKAQAAKDKVGGKRPAAEQASRQTKKKKTIPLSFALSGSEVDDSNRSGSGTHHSASPVNTIISPDVDPTTGGGGLAIESVAPFEEQQSRLSDYQAPQRLWLTETQNQLVDAIRNQNILADDLRILQQEHRGCAGKEAGLVEKLTMVEKEKYDLFDEYKKSLSGVFNQAIAAGWSEDVKVKHSEEDAEAILATAIDYDPECKATFMSAFDSLFTKSYPYPAFVWYFLNIYILGFCFVLDLCNRGNIVHHLATGAWIRLGHLAFRETFVTWPLVLGLIWNVLHSEKYSSLGPWHLDSSGMSCVSRNIRHLAIGAWTHSERITFRHWRLDSSGTYCVLRNIRHLALDTWTHPGNHSDMLSSPYTVLPTLAQACLGIIGVEPDIENMTLNEYLEYKAAKERKLWDNVRSKRSPTNYDKAAFDSFQRNKSSTFNYPYSHNLPHPRPCSLPVQPNPKNHFVATNVSMDVDIECRTIAEYNLYVDYDFDKILDDLFRMEADNLKRIGQDIVQDSICEQDVDSEEDQEEDGDDGDILVMRDITVENVERIRQLLTSNVPNVMDDIIQPLIPKTIHTTPPNEDYVADY
nr:hypothetical protein [Tanacetum cinerariifolium]